jgi:hypothetical protein
VIETNAERLTPTAAADLLWRAVGDAVAFRGLETRDAWSLGQLRNVIASGDKPAALEAAAALDTAVRDVIPSEVWVWCGGQLIVHGEPISRPAAPPATAARPVA